MSGVTSPGLVTGGVLGASFLAYMFATKPKFLYASQNDLNKDLRGKVIMVTGANSGIGLEMSRQFYNQGAKVIMTGRSQERLDKARQSILNSADKGVEHPEPTILITDFADMDQLKVAANEFLGMNIKLDILMQNAGVMMFGERQTTKQGLELHIGTNHFGPFLFTELIRKQIKKGGRICMTSSNYIDQGPSARSDGMVYSSINYDDLHWKSREYDYLEAYAESKHANGLHAIQLAELKKNLANKIFGYSGRRNFRKIAYIYNYTL